jgi:hypothetical protein
MSWSPGGDTGEEPSPSYQEEGYMKDQFQQQQERIAELKELLKQNEDKLMNKEKEVEVNKNILYMISEIFSSCDDVLSCDTLVW